jgi:hypothetical protein
MENRLFRAIVISVVIFSGAFVLASVLLGNRLPDIRGGNEITVTGSAKKRIKSDLIVWRVQIRASAPRLADAFAQINRDTTRVRAFLISKGIPETQLVASAIDTHISRKGSTTYDDGEAHQNGPILATTCSKRSPCVRWTSTRSAPSRAKSRNSSMRGS